MSSSHAETGHMTFAEAVGFALQSPHEDWGSPQDLIDSRERQDQLSPEGLGGEVSRLYGLVYAVLESTPEFRDAAVEHALTDSHNRYWHGIHFARNGMLYEVKTKSEDASIEIHEAREVDEESDERSDISRTFVIRSQNAIFNPRYPAPWLQIGIDYKSFDQDRKRGLDPMMPLRLSNSTQAVAIFEELIARLQAPVPVSTQEPV